MIHTGTSSALRNGMIALAFLTACVLIMPYKSTAEKGRAVRGDLAQVVLPSSTLRWLDFIPNTVGANPAAFFQEYATDLGLGRFDKMILVRRKQLADGTRHYRYQQIHRGVKVEDAQYILHEREGYFKGANGRVISGLHIDIAPSITESAAFAEAMRFIGAQRYAWDDAEQTKPAAELLIVKRDIEAEPLEHNYALVYKFVVASVEPYGLDAVYIHAHTGEPLRKHSLIKYGGVQTNITTRYYGSQDIFTENNGTPTPTTHRLVDDCAGNGQVVIHTRFISNNNDDVTSGNNTWTTADQQNAASLHWAMRVVLEYYDVEHNRNSFDDNGAQVDAFMSRVGANRTNASYEFGATFDRFRFGDGDIDVIPSTLNRDAAVSLDIVGHEFTHAVVRYALNLNNTLEPNALNESFADIFGTAIEHYAVENFAGLPDADYLLFEDHYQNHARRMDDPTSDGDPDTYLSPLWSSAISPHGRAGVQNHFFYLLAEGGTGTNDNAENYSVQGIGITDAVRIMYRVLEAGHLNSDADHIDAREAALRAAEDEFGACSNEVLQVANAWFAVGVGSQVPTFQPEICGDFPNGTYPDQQSQTRIVTGAACPAPGTTTIRSGASMNMIAALEIDLQSETEIEAGAEVEAFIDECVLAAFKGAYASHEFSESIPEQVPNSAHVAPELYLSVAPNPASGAVTLRYSVAIEGPVELAVFDAFGRTIETVVSAASIQPGSYNMQFDVSDLPQGAYNVALRAAEFSVTQPLRIMR